MSQENSSPNVFISYSWNVQEIVIEIADRLICDGIQVVIDVYDLNSGNDKYAFMERMLTDASITHVLIFCESQYAQKANERKAGVGTETQIISDEIYSRIEQSKFLPIILEFDENGKPCLPVFLKSRVWIDFSTPERINENWEKLIRHLYGKPSRQKPKLGKTPLFITDEVMAPPTFIEAKYNSFKQAVMQEKKSINLYRQEFFDACFDYVKTFQTQEIPADVDFGQKIVDDCSKLRYVRDFIVNWILLESPFKQANDFSTILAELLEKFRENTVRPLDPMIRRKNSFDAEKIFLYETFLYSIAALLKSGNFETINHILTRHYLQPESERNSNHEFSSFRCFYTCSNEMNRLLQRTMGKDYLSPIAELIKRQAQRRDISFNDIIQADMVALLMSIVQKNSWWYPQLIAYAGYMTSLPFFLKATRHSDFMDLSIITGINSADTLRTKVQNYEENNNSLGRVSGLFTRTPCWQLMNMERLDTLK